MILEADASQLEWRCAAFLSQDQVMLQEIWDGVDQHQYTLDHFFKGKGNRTDAKIFNFRMIYGTTAWGLHLDHKMPRFSVKEYEEIIEKFLGKYHGLDVWQQSNIKRVNECGFLVAPTGRVLRFPQVVKKDGSIGYHEPHIKNYPVQSFATADLMKLAMVQAWKRVIVKKIEAKFIMQVHDSLVYDVADEYVLPLALELHNVFKNLPDTVHVYYGFTMNIPMDSEIKVGPSWGDTEVYTAHLN